MRSRVRPVSLTIRCRAKMITSNEKQAHGASGQVNLLVGGARPHRVFSMIGRPLTGAAPGIQRSQVGLHGALCSNRDPLAWRLKLTLGMAEGPPWIFSTRGLASNCS